MNSDESELKARTKRFGLRAIKVVEALPRNLVAGVIGKQLIRCSTSVGANYRSVCRARSTADFVAKLAIVEEEADESCFWLELLMESGLVKPNRLDALLTEANEITAIMTASRQTAARNHKSKIENRK